MNLFSKTADFEEVKKDEEALLYHAVKFQSGHRYPLAVQCFSYIQVKELEKRIGKDTDD